MKDTQKRFLGAVLAASSVVGVVAPSVTAMATVVDDESKATAEDLKNVIAEYSTKLEANPIFANYHRVQYAAERLAQYDAAASEAAKASIAKYADKVFTAEVTAVLDKMNEFANGKSMANYDALVTKEIKAMKNQEDAAYLMGRLDVWGKAIVFEVDPNYVVATDAIIKVADLRKAGKLDEAQIQADAAKKAIKEIKTYEANGAYLEAALKVESDAVETEIANQDLHVTSVVAKNGKEIEVKFNKAVSKDSAETETNYIFKDANTDATKNIEAQEAELQDDNKTVIVKLVDKDDNKLDVGVALNNKINAKYLVTVQNVLTDNDDEMKDYSEIVSLFDNVKPEVAGLEYRDADTLRVNLSEPVKLSLNGLKSAVKVKSNGATVTLPTGAIVEKNIDGDGMYFEISRSAAGLDADKTYSLEVDGLTDYAGNALTKFTGDINFKKDTVDPKVEKVEVLAENALKVTFDEKVKLNTIVAKIDGKDAAVSHFEKDTDDQDDKTFILKIDKVNAIDGKAIVNIHDFKDFADNVGDSFTQEVKFAESHPALVSTTPEYKTIDKVKYAVYSFDRDVQASKDLAHPADPTVTVKHVDTDGITQSKDDVAVRFKAANFDIEANEVAISMVGLEEGNYNFDLEKDNVSDDYGQRVEKINLEFVKGDKGIKTDVTSVVTKAGDNDKIIVTFEAELTKQGIKDAANINNYRVDDVIVAEKAEVTSKTTVELTMKEGAIESKAATRIVEVNGIDGVKSYNDNKNAQIIENTTAKIDTAELTAYNTIKLTMTEDVANDANTKAAFEIKKGDTTIASTDIDSVTVNKSIITIKVKGDKPLQTDSKITVKVLDDETKNKFVKDLSGNITDEVTKDVNQNFDNSTELAEDVVKVLEASCAALNKDNIAQAETNVIAAQAKVEKVNNASERSLLQDRVNVCKTKIADAKKVISDAEEKAKNIAAAVTKIDVVVKTTGDATTISQADLELVNGAPVVTANMDAYKAAIVAAEDKALDTDVKIKAMITEVNQRIVSFDAIADIQAGKIGSIDAKYTDAATAKNNLPKTVKATLADGTKVDVSVTWEDTDTYDSTKEGGYTFTAKIASYPVNVNNSSKILAPTVKLVVAK